MSTQLLFRQQMTREFLMAGDGGSILMGEFLKGIGETGFLMGK